MTAQLKIEYGWKYKEHTPNGKDIKHAKRFNKALRKIRGKYLLSIDDIEIIENGGKNGCGNTSK